MTQKFLLLLCPILIMATTHVKAQDSITSDQQSVEQAILKWADSTLESYNEPRFENFVANYTDEYLMKKMRADAIEKSIERIEKSKKKGTYKGSEADYKKSIYNLELRKEEALEGEKDFHPKVTSYTISFWSNILLDSGVYNHFEFIVTLDDYYKVIKHKVNSSIGDDKKGKIRYK